MVREKVSLSRILTRHAFENAIRVNAAIGGSTNAVIHLIAIAGRLGVKLSLDDWDALGKGVHTLVNLMPNGKYLMEDFFYAGGLPVIIRALGKQGLLHKTAPTANGRTIWENNKRAPCWNDDVIMPFEKPFKRNTGIAVLRGNLCPDGAIIKPSAATPKLMKHKGRAVVFESIEDFHKRIDDPKLDIDADCIMVLKNCGPKGYPGMAEVGNMPLGQPPARRRSPSIPASTARASTGPQIRPRPATIPEAGAMPASPAASARSTRASNATSGRRSPTRPNAPAACRRVRSRPASSDSTCRSSWGEIRRRRRSGPSVTGSGRCHAPPDAAATRTPSLGTA
jgi:dihydroxy-acid dehydratase